MRRSRGNRGGRPAPQGLFSRCGDHILRGSVHTLIKLYEDLSRTTTNEIEAENFRQHAEHYRRIGNGSVC